MQSIGAETASQQAGACSRMQCPAPLVSRSLLAPLVRRKSGSRAPARFGFGAQCAKICRATKWGDFLASPPVVEKAYLPSEPGLRYGQREERRQWKEVTGSGQSRRQQSVCSSCGGPSPAMSGWEHLSFDKPFVCSTNVAAASIVPTFRSVSASAVHRVITAIVFLLSGSQRESEQELRRYRYIGLCLSVPVFVQGEKSPAQSTKP